MWGVEDYLNAFGITHLGEIPEIILLNTVELLDNVATRLHRALCVCDVVVQQMIDLRKTFIHAGVWKCIALFAFCCRIY